MGVLYEAEDLSLERHVALKFLPDDLVATNEALERFTGSLLALRIIHTSRLCSIMIYL
jgi:hypothetical protein